MNPFTRIAIVDDKQSNRVSLNERLISTNEYEVVFMAVNGDEFLDKMKSCSENQRPQVVLMDVDMPVMDGIDAVKRAKEIYNDVLFLMVTVFDDDEKIFNAIKAGASGYLLKDESGKSISNAIREVIEFGGAPMSPRIARKALNLLSQTNIVSETQKDNNPSGLSSRELEILDLMVQGLDYKGVAEKLNISPHTVRKHIANIYSKLHVSSKLDAVKIALKKGWFNSLFA
ncbi:MAG: response regulator transcription factor [Bacteroidia bacterium]